MKACRIAFAFVLVLAVLIIGPVLRDRGRDGTSLGLAVSWADAGETGAPGLKAGSAGSRLTAQEVRQAFTAHNRARAEVGTAALVWSDGLARYAQEWADHLASTRCGIEHRPRSGKWKKKHGENLFMGTAGYYGVSDAAATWEKEKSAYHGEAIDTYNFSSFGHYTQLIWRDTRSIGCAKAQCGSNVIIVCNYDPPGNILGRRPY